MEEDDQRREAAIASAPPLRPNFKSSGVSQSQLAKFQELHRRRLQIKARSKTKEKPKGTSYKTGKAHGKSTGAKDLMDDTSSDKVDDSSVSTSGGNTVKDSSSVQQEPPAIAAKKRHKLFWGLDTKERWERKANM